MFPTVSSGVPQINGSDTGPGFWCDLPVARIRNGWSNTQLGLYGDIIEMLPVRWLDRLNNPVPQEYTNLLDCDILVSLDDLWKNIQETGLHDPVLLNVCEPTGIGRVEAGNQRVEMAKRQGETYLPTVCLISFKPVISPLNGTHVFDVRDDLVIPIATAGTERLVAPSSVFRSIAEMKDAGWLPDQRTYGILSPAPKMRNAAARP